MSCGWLNSWYTDTCYSIKEWMNNKLDVYNKNEATFYIFYRHQKVLKELKEKEWVLVNK